MLRWTPRPIVDPEDEASERVAVEEDTPNSQPYNVQPYDVSYWESFRVGAGGSITFCVRHWPAMASQPARYEFSAVFAAAVPGFRRPALLWDVEGSPSFRWAPPQHLPATEGAQQADHSLKCMVTQFVAGSKRDWRLKLMWLYRSSSTGNSMVPSKLSVQIQTSEGCRIAHPVNGRSFQVPLRSELDAGDGLRFELRAPVSTGRNSGGSPELEEVRNELERRRTAAQQQEAPLGQRDREASELEPESALRPSPEQLAELAVRREEEAAHRRHCQAELLELRGRPRVFCLVKGTAITPAGGDRGGGRPICSLAASANNEVLKEEEEETSSRQPWLLRHSRTEVLVPSRRERFDFDLVPPPGVSTEELWDEVRPVLEASLLRPAGAVPSHVCVLLCGEVYARRTPASDLGVRQRALTAMMVEFLFRHFVEAADPNGSAIASTARGHDRSREHSTIAMSMGEVRQDGLHDLLLSTPATQGAAGGTVAPLVLSTPATTDDAAPILPVDVRDLLVLSPRTQEEVLCAYDRAVAVRGCGHCFVSLCAARSSGGVARLVIIDHGGTEDGLHCAGAAAAMATVAVAGPGKGSRDGANAAAAARSLPRLLRSAQACVDRTSEACGSAATGTSSSAAGGIVQGRTLLLAHVSPLERDMQESLSTLQLCVGAASLQERVAPKLNDEGGQCRRQFARLLQENIRLRAELHERGGGSGRHDQHASMCTGACAAATPSVVVDPEARSLPEDRRSAVSSPSPSARSLAGPLRCSRASLRATFPRTAGADRGAGLGVSKENRTPDNRRRRLGAAACMPSR